MLFFHVSNCCSHHRNVIWSPRGGEVVHETICLLEVIYKVKMKLWVCPLITSLLSMQRKSKRTFADFFCCLLSSLPTHATPRHTRTYEQTHTRAHLHPLFKIGIEILSTLEEVTSAWKQVEQHQHGRQNLRTGHAALPRSWAEGVLLETGLCRFVAWGVSPAFLEISPRHSAAPGTYVLQYRLHSWGVPFTESEVTRSPRRSKDAPAKMPSLSRAWGSTPCRHPWQDKGPYSWCISW